MASSVLVRDRPSIKQTRMRARAGSPIAAASDETFFSVNGCTSTVLQRAKRESQLSCKLRTMPRRAMQKAAIANASWTTFTAPAPVC
jgi:hypothetical protein